MELGRAHAEKDAAVKEQKRLQTTLKKACAHTRHALSKAQLWVVARCPRALVPCAGAVRPYERSSRRMHTVAWERLSGGVCGGLWCTVVL
jgi:hypothetical protein